MPEAPPARGSGGLRWNRSLAPALLLFWPFQSAPRLWYLATTDPPAGVGAWAHALPVLAVGLLRDGLVVGALWLLVWGVRRAGAARALPARALSAAGAAATALLALLLAGLAVDVEFFRYFGFHSTVTHLSLAAEWEKIGSSISVYLGRPATVLFVLGLPAAFAGAAAALPSGPTERFAWGGRGLLAAALLCAAGGAAGGATPADPLSAKLSESYGLAFAREMLRGPERDADPAAVAEILEVGPLPHPVIDIPEWRRVDPRYPLVRATDHHLCRLGESAGPACEADADGDGHPVRTDCNDRWPGIHPGAPDAPGDGIDGDCSGLDADPPNVIFVHWEGIRAVNVGSIGTARPATPRFDALAEDGILFTNAYANGTQTRWSLVSVYCSALPRLSNQWIFKHDPELELLCFPDVLRRLGYHTIYVHGGYIGFAGKGPRLSRWFETRYDRTNEPIRSMPRFHWGATDRDVLEFTFEMLKERDDPRPFFLTVATLAVHHPFGLPESRFALARHTDPRNQIANVIHYSDDALGEFLERVLADPELRNTVVVVAADHGVNWFAPKADSAQSVLWEDLVWVPLALLGNAWNRPPGRVDEVRQLADVGPTVLDRLGVEIPNPFVGHSLLRRAGDRELRAFFATANGGRSAGLRTGRFKFFQHFDTGRRHLFDLAADRREERDLSGDPRYTERMRAWSETLDRLYRANERLVAENRIWSERYWLPPEKRP